MRLDISYLFMDPGGNRTILVETLLAPADRKEAAAFLMAGEPSAEQAGFLSDCTDREITLTMAGGEFCGNASMCAAAYCSRRAGKKEARILVHASGVSDPVPVEIRQRASDVWAGRVSMPLPRSIGIYTFSDRTTVPLVRLPGISHVICEKQYEKKDAERLVKRWCRELKSDALGLMFLDEEAGRLTPLVYVPAADTLFWENACGSGTAAVGAWMAAGLDREVHLTLAQPGGTLSVTASKDRLLLEGEVRLLYRRRVSIS